VAAVAAAAGVYYWRLSSQKAALERAATLQRSIRVVKQRDPRLLARLLSHLFTSSVRLPPSILPRVHAPHINSQCTIFSRTVLIYIGVHKWESTCFASR
jgi:hypothetical protein